MDLEAEPAEEELKQQRISTDEFVEMIKNKERNFYIILGERLGSLILPISLEYHFFHPSFGNNDDFDFNNMKWEYLLWYIFSVPRIFADTVEKYADQLRFRVADGMPTIFSGKDVSRFPGMVEAVTIRTNVFTIENVHPIIKINPNTINRRIKDLHDLLTCLGSQVSLEFISEYLWNTKNLNLSSS